MAVGSASGVPECDPANPPLVTIHVLEQSLGLIQFPATPSTRHGRGRYELHHNQAEPWRSRRGCRRWDRGCVFVNHTGRSSANVAWTQWPANDCHHLRFRLASQQRYELFPRVHFRPRSVLPGHLLHRHPLQNGRQSLAHIDERGHVPDKYLGTLQFMWRWWTRADTDSRSPAWTRPGRRAGRRP